jgi:glycine betaine/proline transport system ATP-binding protein
MTQAIEVEHLWKVYGAREQEVLPAMRRGLSKAEAVARCNCVIGVADATFTVGEGEIFCVMGLSGSGKSTLVRCISRLTDATRGEIWVGGQDVMKMSDAELREVRRHKISMVFQNFGLLPHRRVIDNVAYGLEVRGIDRKARVQTAEQMLELVGLAGWEHYYPRQLSGGMQQRVGLARALAVDPEILLFDEPFSALDPLIRREMQDELLRLQSTLHKTSVFITHDFAEALKLGDRIAVMRNGEIVQVGSPEELVLHPRNDYVAAFTQDAPRAKVLTAATIMRNCPPDFRRDGQPGVDADAKLEELMPLLAESEAPLAVLNKSGEALGCVDRQAILRALVQ